MNAEAIRKICLALPAATEDVKWGADLVFSVGDKMFCATSFENPFKCSVKVADDEFDEICSQQGFTPAPYLARAKWVMVTEDAQLSVKDWEHLIKNSYQLVLKKLTKRQRSQLNI